MLPVLLDLKFLKIYTFGVFLMLAFFWGCFLLWKNIRLTPYKEDDVFDGLFLSLLGGLFTARLFYVILNFKDFGLDFLKFILINGYPGLSLIGALIGGLFTLYIYYSPKKIDFGAIIDYFITPLFIGLFFGKLGSFFSGSEVGTKTNFMLRIKYQGFEGLRHLTPFYEGLLFAVAAFISYRILFSIRREKFEKGFLFYFFVWYFSAVYFLFDKVKVTTLYLHGLSFNMIASAVLLLTTTGYFVYYFRSLIFNFIKKPASKYK